MKSGGESFTHGVCILDYLFKIASNILDVLFGIKQTIIIVQIYLCNDKVTREAYAQHILA
jgi:hypothetical protein